ncbi:MAG: ribosomal protein L13e [Nitrososphaerales archaeon]
MTEEKKPSKQKRAKSKKEGKGPTEEKKALPKVKVEQIPKGTKPSPIVTRPTGSRKGRGFSPLELSRSGISSDYARRIKIPVDLRRGTYNEVNVKALKDWITPARVSKTVNKTPKKNPKTKTKKAT